MKTNYKIEILPDHFADNPRNDRDCLPTLYTFGGREYGESKYGQGLYELLKVKNLTSKKTKLLQAMEIEGKDRKEGIADDTESALQYYIENLEDIDVLYDVLYILGYKVYGRNSRGYCQGDVLDCILIADNEYIKNTGIKNKDINESLKNASKLFDARARGDTYGIRIYEVIPLYREDGSLSSETEEETIEFSGTIYGREELESHYSYVQEYVTKEQFDHALENIQY